MPYEDLIELLDSMGGDDALLAINFDNNRRMFFNGKEHFDRNKNIKKLGENYYIVFYGVDPRGLPYEIYTHMDHIQGVFTIPIKFQREMSFDVRYIMP